MYSDPRKSLETRPSHVALVCLGPSYYDFLREAVGRKGQRVQFDEVWTVNRGAFAFRHDKCFIMDDFKWIENEDHNYAESLAGHDKPLITSTIYEGYPMAVRYPLEMVLQRIGDDLLNNTVAYAIAYAMSTGVKTLSLYGADFYYPSIKMREEGSQAVAYLLGMCRAFGMQYRLPNSTSLLNAFEVRIDEKTGRPFRPLYGFHRKAEIPTAPPHPFVHYAREFGMNEESYAALAGGLANGPGFATGQNEEVAQQPHDADREPQPIREAVEQRGAASIHTAGQSLERGGSGDQDGRPARMVPRRASEGVTGGARGGGMEGPYPRPEVGAGDSQYPAHEVHPGKGPDLKDY